MTPLAKKNILFGLLFTTFTTPSIFFMMGLPMILQMRGFDASFIGFFQIVGLSAIGKFLLSPPVDRFVFQNNHYKKWILGAGGIYVLLLLCLSAFSLEEDTSVVFILIFFTVFVATFADIPLNALAIKVFSCEERMVAGSYKMSAYFLAGLLGGGVFLLFYNRTGWTVTFLTMAFLVLFSLLALFGIHENHEKVPQHKVSFQTIVSFFTQEKIGIWVFILSFYFAFISAVWVFMKPYLISKGIDADSVAFFVGIYGSIVGFFGGYLAAYLGRRFDKKTLLILFSFFNALSMVLLLLMEIFTFHVTAWLLAITLTALAIAFSSAIIFAFIMEYARQESKAVDYALQSSLFALTRIVAAVFAGIIISAQSYGVLFGLACVGILGVTFVVIKKFDAPTT